MSSSSSSSSLFPVSPLVFSSFSRSDRFGYFSLFSSCSSSPSETCKLLHELFRNSELFVFSDFLHLPSISSLSSSSDPIERSYYSLLEIFSSGTLKDYQRIQTLPTLNQTETNKLRLLSLLTAASSSSSLSYSFLLSFLDFSSVRDLEELIIFAIGRGLIQGKLDQNQGIFNVQQVAARDLKSKSEVSQIAASLSNWLERSEELMKAVEEKLQSAQAETERKTEKKMKIQEEKEEIKEEKTDSKKNTGKEQKRK